MTKMTKRFKAILGNTLARTVVRICLIWAIGTSTSCRFSRGPSISCRKAISRNVIANNEPANCGSQAATAMKSYSFSNAAVIDEATCFASTFEPSGLK